jgi:RNA polymerase sigma-70 factor (ECF subfamily)
MTPEGSVSQPKQIWEKFTAKADELRAFFRRRLAFDEATASDLTQEVYLRLLRAPSETIENPEYYLFTVARNLAVEYARMRQRQAYRETSMDPLDLPEVSTDLSFEGDVQHEQMMKRYEETVRELAPREQAALTMFYLQGLSQSVIGERLGVSRSMAGKILTQALANCREAMIRKGGV